MAIGVDWLMETKPTRPEQLVSVSRYRSGLEATQSAAAKKEQRHIAMQILADAARDDSLRAEATARIAYLHLVDGNLDAALTTARTALALASRPDDRYLAHFLIGYLDEMIGDLNDAVREFEGALQARPHSQSAALALAALRLRNGDLNGAYALGEHPAADGANANDPWRLLLYGDIAKLPALLESLRSAVRQ